MKKKSRKLKNSDNAESHAYGIIGSLKKIRCAVILIVWIAFRIFTDYNGIAIQYYGTRPPISFANILLYIAVSFAFIVYEIHLRKKYSLPKFKFAYAFSKEELIFFYVILIFELSSGEWAQELFRKIVKLLGVSGW